MSIALKIIAESPVTAEETHSEITPRKTALLAACSAQIPARHPGDVQAAPARKPPRQRRQGGEGCEGRPYRGRIRGLDSPGK